MGQKVSCPIGVACKLAGYPFNLPGITVTSGSGVFNCQESVGRFNTTLLLTEIGMVLPDLPQLSKYNQLVCDATFRFTDSDQNIYTPVFYIFNFSKMHLSFDIPEDVQSTISD